jgi:hypothetical protein
MDTGKFGPPTGSSASGDDRFGYFGGTPSPGSAMGQPVGSEQGATTSSAFGAPPAASDRFGGPSTASGQFGGPPQSQFGGPAAYPDQPVAYPYAGPTPTGSSGRSSTSRWVAAVVAAVVVIGGGYFGWNAVQRNRPVTLPATFGGLPVDTEQTAQEADQSMLTSMRAGNQGIKMDAKIYGTLKDGIILGVARGHDDLSNDLHGDGLGTPFTIGNSLCAQASTGVAYTLCVRTSTNLTVVVATLSGAPEQTAALVDQAWGLF